MLGSQRPPEDVVSASAHMAAKPAEPGNLLVLFKTWLQTMNKNQPRELLYV